MAKAHYLEAHEALADTLVGSEVGWLDRSRRSAADRFAEVGFPTLGDEDWKYTNIRSITKENFRPARAPSETPGAQVIDEASIDGLRTHRLVFCDGYLVQQDADTPLPEGVRACGLAQMVTTDPGRVETILGSTLVENPHGFTSLNGAFLTDGAYIDVDPDVICEDPIELLFLTSPGASGQLIQPRNIIRQGRHSRLQVIERYYSPHSDRALTNAVTEVRLEPGASLSHYKLQEEGRRVFHIGSLFARINENSSLNAHSVCLGGAITRNEARVEIDGGGAECYLNGLYIGRDRQHIDNYTHIAHNEAHGLSREHYRGILDDRSRAVFHGRIVVKPDSQLTDSEQRNENLLLSPHAEVNTKPQLEIYADDVKCAHGATVGQLEADALFYLRSRGLDEPSARVVLTRAFADEIIGKIESEPLFNYLGERLNASVASSPADSN